MPIKENPFPGLKAFQPEQADIYFGREVQREELLVRLRARRFLAVVGTSGSGKSSLIRAGLIPDLRSGYLDKGGPAWRVVLFNPGNTPFRELAKALACSFTQCEPNSIEKILRVSSFGLNRFVQQFLNTEAENLLIVIDQFEELIRYPNEEASAFVRLMLASTGQDHLADPGSEGTKAVASLPIYIVLTMRSDFLGKCSRFRGLPEALNDNQYLVPRLTREQQQDAIECPIEISGGRITPRLVQQLLNDVGDNPDQLPVLQHALMRTWDESAADRIRGRDVDIDHYVAIGGMQEALNRDADKAFDKLERDPRLETIAKKLFQRLVEPGNVDEETRRPTLVSDLARITKAERSEVIRVVNVFQSRGFLTLANAEDPLVDIPHESLIRLWSMLRRWVDEERKAADIYLGLVKASFERLGVHRGVPLLLAQRWLTETQPNSEWAKRYTPDSPGAFQRALEFLEDSRRSARNRRLLQVTTAGLLVSLLVVVALVSLSSSRNQRKNATIIQGLLERTRSALGQVQQEKDHADELLVENRRTNHALESTLIQVKTERDRATELGKTDKLYREGTAALVQADPASAISKFKQALKSYERDQDFEAAGLTEMTIGRANSSLRNYADAIQNFKSALVYYDLTNEPKATVEALMQLGDAYLVPVSNVRFVNNAASLNRSEIVANFDSALQAYGQAYQLNSDSVKRVEIAGKIVHAYKTLLDAYKNHPEEVTASAISELHEKELEAQKKELQASFQLSDASQQRAGIFSDIGDNLIEMNRPSEAIASYHSANEIYRLSGPVGMVDTTFRKIAGAVRVGTQVYTDETSQVERYYLSEGINLQHDPFYNAPRQLTLFYRAAGDSEKALPLARQAVDISSQSLALQQSSGDYYTLGQVGQSLHESDVVAEAIATLSLFRYAGLFPSFYDPFFSGRIKTLTDGYPGGHEAILAWFSARIDEAKKSYNKASEAKNMLFECVLRQDDSVKVEQCVQQALPAYKQTSDRDGVRLLLALMVRSEVVALRWEGAEGYYEELSKDVRPDDKPAFKISVRQLGAEIHHSEKAFDAEIEDHLELARLYKGCGDGLDEGNEYFQIAQLFDMGSKTKNAIDYYNRAVGAYPAKTEDAQIRIGVFLSNLVTDYERISDMESAQRIKKQIASLHAK
jgi:tetratricopeptide (TPR) repeat protein